jgi:hypothetical protein
LSQARRSQIRRYDENEQVPNPFNAVANVLVTAPGVVLDLLAVFGTTGVLTTVVKVAAVALATVLLLGIVLNGLVSMKDVGNPPRSTVIRLMFNLTLWALALGILGPWNRHRASARPRREWSCKAAQCVGALQARASVG